MKMKLLILGLFVFGFSNASYAQTSPKIALHQKQQQKRIADGEKSGELSKRETARLNKQLANIQVTKKRAKADGVVTRKEKAIIQSKRAQLNKDICLKKRNKVTR